MFSKAKNRDAENATPSPISDVNEPMVRKAATSAKAPRGRSSGRPAGVPSIISSDVVIKGTLESAGEIQFDGEIDGNLIAKGLVVGEGSKVVGEIVAEKVRVSGTVEGSIRGVSVELAGSAEVRGDIVHSSLSIENGARFEGNCRHSDDPLTGGSDKPRARPRPIPPPNKTDAASVPVRQEMTAEVVDAEIEPSDAIGENARELMPTRNDPAPDRAFVEKPSVGNLR